MSNRLQVLVDAKEYKTFQEFANKSRLTLGEWVRQVLRKEVSQTPLRSSEERLRRIYRAAENQCPVSNIDEILKEIEKGYGQS